MPQRTSPTSSGETEISAAIRPKSRSHHPTDLGLSGRAVRDRAAKGRLHRIHNGVYTATPPTEQGRWVAALLACGPRAVLSHTSAAALWDLARDTPTVHVTLRGAARTTRPGVAVHGGRLDPSEVVTRNDIPCTTVARTLLDLAATQSHRRVELAIDRAEELRVFDLNGLRALLEHRRGQRGSAVLSKVLDAYDGPDQARSPAERRLLALVRQARLPKPTVNAWLPLSDGDGYRPDLLWEDHRLIVEVDGRTHHARRLAFEHDRRRDRRLALAGYETRRYAAREIQREPDHVLAELRAFLSQPRRHP